MAGRARVRFYFDADILGLAKVICAMRNDCTFPGDPGTVIHKKRRPVCAVPDPKWKDWQWIPAVAEQDWVAITRDSNILDHLSLLQLIQDHSLRIVAIGGDDGGNRWGQLEVFMTQWRRIEELTRRRGPLLYRVGRSAFNPVDLQGRLEEVRRESGANPHYPAEAATTGRRARVLQDETLFD